MASSLSVRAIASSTWTLALIGRPCSSQVYQVTPTPASWASSSRRSPAVRRRVPAGRPTSSGLIRSLRLRRNAASSVLRAVLAARPCSVPASWLLPATVVTLTVAILPCWSPACQVVLVPG